MAVVTVLAVTALGREPPAGCIQRKSLHERYANGPGEGPLTRGMDGLIGW